MDWFSIAFIAILFIVLVGYICYMSVIKGPARRPETGRPMRTNGNEISAAKGAEGTYATGQQVSAVPPMPVHRKTEREPTSSFEDYTEQETPEEE
jgi:hypothetical protein